MYRGALAIGLLAGCFHPSPQAGAPCNTNHECPSGQSCNALNLCEPPGSSADDGGLGADDAPIDAMVDACPVTQCQGNDLVGCGGSTTCANGCSATGTPHCAVL